MNILNLFFEYLGISLLFVCTILYFKSYSKHTIALKYFSWYLLAICCIQITSFVLSKLTIRNLFLSHFYFWIQLTLLSLFYKSLFTSKQKKYVSIVFICVCLILITQYLINPNKFFVFNTLEIFITTFPIVIYTMTHLYNALTKKGKFMYINAAILIYLTTSTLIYILGDYLSNLRGELISNIWFLNKVLYVVYISLILTEWKMSILPLKNNK